MLNSENNLELDKIKSFQKIMKKYQEILIKMLNIQMIKMAKN